MSVDLGDLEVELEQAADEEVTLDAVDDPDATMLEPTLVEDDLPSEEMPVMEEDLAAAEDEVSTKLDLAKAYIDMGDADGARSTLEEVINEGSEEQRDEAQELMRQIA